MYRWNRQKQFLARYGTLEIAFLNRFNHKSYVSVCAQRSIMGIIATEINWDQGMEK